MGGLLLIYPQFHTIPFMEVLKRPLAGRVYTYHHLSTSCINRPICTRGKVPQCQSYHHCWLFSRISYRKAVCLLLDCAASNDKYNRNHSNIFITYDLIISFLFISIIPPFRHIIVSHMISYNHSEIVNQVYLSQSHIYWSSHMHIYIYVRSHLST